MLHEIMPKTVESIMNMEKTAASVPEKSDEADEMTTSEKDQTQVFDGQNQNLYPPRVERWRSKLLDLSRRNRLLNFKDSRQAIPIVFPYLSKLEDGLSSGQKFTINPATELIMGADVSKSQKNSSSESIAVKYIGEEFSKHRLHSSLEETELGKRLLSLFRQTKIDIEEGGVNTLFLCPGFLEWTEGADSNLHTYRAPLILIPLVITRASVKEGFTIEKSDEEPTLNVTLLEMLRLEFGITINGLDPLPCDESGVNIDAVIKIFADAVSHMPSWNVVGELWLGRLIFSKIIMWDDMGRRLDEMRKSPVVAHLIKGGGSFDDGIEPVSPNEVDTAFKSEDIICPMSADSSQLAAVLSAGRGKNFVLHGPPGTGKSQTITNLIANLLCSGKTVLFVAEKRAALEVVQKRLKKLGLGAFCLELHSSKSGKADVLAQFVEALSFSDKAEPTSWSATTSELSSVRSELSGYVSALHHVYPSGLSPYMAFSEMLSSEDKEASISHVKEFENLDARNTSFSGAIDLAGELVARASEIDAELFSRLSFCRAEEWTPEWEQDAISAASALHEATSLLLSAIEKLSSAHGFPPFFGLSKKAVGGIAGIATHIQSLRQTPKGFFTSSWNIFSAKISPVIGAGIECRKVLEKYPYFDFDKITGLDAVSIESVIEKNKQRNLISAFFSNRSQMKKLSACLRFGKKIRFVAKESKSILDDIISYNNGFNVINGIGDSEKRILGTLFNGINTDFSMLEELVAKADDLFANVISVSNGDAGVIDVLCRAIDAVLSSEEIGRDDYRKVTNAYTAFTEKYDAFNKVLRANNSSESECAGFLEYALEVSDSISSVHEGLRCWCLWNRIRTKSISIGISPVADAIESGEIGSADIEYSVRRRFCGKLIAEAINESAVLRDFLGASQDVAVRKFSQYDDEVAELSRRMVIARLSEKLPGARGLECPSTTELGILKRECEKKSRHKPVRTLLEQIPKISRVLKPCFLMSPLSIAQYLPPGGDLFDLVVFDEASQVTVWDAIGAMARGKQVIIVGDPMQLPPTTFFQRQMEDEEIPDDEIEGLESILDECMAAGLSEMYLQWHYRSRHESLIAFSNVHYYGNKLFTFPSACREGSGLGVSFHYVQDGVYDRKKTRTNRKEAEAVVAAVMERLLNPEFANKSTGVVTFSQAQQTLIEDMIDEKRSEHPEIERFFSDVGGEPFFVKNLENVQGDERDAIFFSIGYAKDTEDKLAMNFGPLNRAGGERRLNVAITRAREQVVVFSSITAADIDTGKTQAIGAIHLKSFLRYAENNALPVVQASDKNREIAEVSGFEDEVAEFLRCHGYKIDRRVGRAGYKIDIAVQMPDDPGTYAIGIECDGGAYRDSSSARDRDKLRALVLRGLGWRLSRVWSLSWWFDRDRAERKLLEEIETAIRGDSVPAEMKFKKTKFIKENREEKAFKVSAKPEFLEDYKVSKTEVEFAKRQECFNVNDGPSFIIPQMTRIIEDEGPIVESLLFRRIVHEWGFSRIGTAMLQVLKMSVPADVAFTEQLGERVYWPAGKSPSSYKIFRRPGKSELSKRAIDEIPIEEIRNAMQHVIKQYQSCPDATLFLEAAKLLGFVRVPPSAKPRFAAAHEILAEKTDKLR